MPPEEQTQVRAFFTSVALADGSGTQVTFSLYDPRRSPLMVVEKKKKKKKKK